MSKESDKKFAYKYGNSYSLNISQLNIIKIKDIENKTNLIINSTIIDGQVELKINKILEILQKKYCKVS